MKIWCTWWGPLSDEQGEETVVRAVEGTGEQMRIVDGMAVFYLAKFDESRRDKIGHKERK